MRLDLETFPSEKLSLYKKNSLARFVRFNQRVQIAKYEITVQFSLDLETFPFEKLSLSKNFPLLLVRKWFNQRVH